MRTLPAFVAVAVCLAGCADQPQDPVVENVLRTFVLQPAPDGLVLQLRFDVGAAEGSVGFDLVTDLRHPFDASVLDLGTGEIHRLGLWPAFGETGEASISGIPGPYDGPPDNQTFRGGAALPPGRYVMVMGYESTQPQDITVYVGSGVPASMAWGNETGYHFRDGQRAADQPGEVWLGQGPAVARDDVVLTDTRGGILFWIGVVAGGSIDAHLEGPAPEQWSIQSADRLTDDNYTLSRVLAPGRWTLQTNGQWVEGGWLASFVPLPEFVESYGTK